MIVWKIVPDFKFKSYLASDPNQVSLSEVQYASNLMSCASMSENWRPLKLYSESPKLKHGNFARCWGGGFLIDRNARDILERKLDGVCEFLPFLEYEGDTLHLLNVVSCTDCLDHLRTKRAVDSETGAQLTMIQKYEFIPEQLTHSLLFKLPRRIGLFTVSGQKNASDEFKALIESERLTGLKFEKIWSNDED
jgi:hypothetical protein